MLIQASGGCAAMGCLVLPALVVGGLGLAIVLPWRRSVARRAAEARRAYDESLALLRIDPTNAALRQQALERGRAWVYLANYRRGIFAADEIAIGNEVNAACAGASPTTAAVPASIEERLRHLDSLKASGMISDTEYNESRRRILAEM